MKKKSTSIIITIVIVLAIGWKSYQKYENQKTKDATIEATCVPVTATIKRVSPSGVRTKRSTILQVDYLWNDTSKIATIRKSGYQEGRYTTGDSIIIYIDPNNLEVVK